MSELEIFLKRQNNKNAENNIKNNEKQSYSDENDPVIGKMKEFLNKPPKIGIWSYPAFLVLHYLYTTKPGFKISKTARDALELGLRTMYPELFDKATKVIEIYSSKKK
jgi:hypothetical protein